MTVNRAIFDACRSLGITALLAAALLVPGTSGAAGPGACYSAVIPDAIVLPDGSVHEAGKLRVCYAREFSPVAGLHETFINGRAVGMFISRHAEIELTGDAEEAFFVFRRTRLGELELEGYATPNGEGHDTFLIGNAKPRGFDVISHWRTALNSDRFDQEDETTVILLAASTN